MTVVAELSVRHGVDDPAAVQARSVALGAKEVDTVRSSHGWLMGRIIDPFGHTWEIGKPLGVWPPSSGRPEHVSCK